MPTLSPHRRKKSADIVNTPKRGFKGNDEMGP